MLFISFHMLNRNAIHLLSKWQFPKDERLMNKPWNHLLHCESISFTNVHSSLIIGISHIGDGDNCVKNCNCVSDALCQLIHLPETTSDMPTLWTALNKHFLATSTLAAVHGCKCVVPKHPYCPKLMHVPEGQSNAWKIAYMRAVVMYTPWPLPVLQCSVVEALILCYLILTQGMKVPDPTLPAVIATCT